MFCAPRSTRYRAVRLDEHPKDDTNEHVVEVVHVEEVHGHTVIYPTEVTKMDATHIADEVTDEVTETDVTPIADEVAVTHATPIVDDFKAIATSDI